MCLDLVSVIIRTKDRLEMLKNAIESVSKQTHSNIELIVVNDGGCSVESLISAIDYPSIRQKTHISFESNKGRSTAANAGLDASSGNFIMFLDDDDWVGEEHIAGLVEVLGDRDDCELVYSATECVELIDDSWQTSSVFSSEFDRARLLVENYIPIHSVLFSRKLLESGCRFDTNFQWLEDWDFWLQASSHTNFCFHNKITAYYRIAAESGFGVKSDSAVELKYREMIYRKWVSLWSSGQLIEVLDRARSYPQLNQLQQLVEVRSDGLRIRESQLEELDADLQRARKQLAEVDPDLQRARKQLNVQEEQVKGLVQQLEDLTKHLQNTIISHEESVSQMQRKQAEEVTELQAGWDEIAGEFRSELDRIYQSKSWRYSRPFRQVSTALRIGREHGLAGIFQEISAKRSKSDEPVSIEVPDVPDEHSIAESYSGLKFLTHKRPTISIVIPVFNKHLYTFHCLKSILDNSSPELSYEVIVVNDQSTDETEKMLTKMSGVKVITNKQNQGFIRSINLGVIEAVGEYLMILNNDTEVQVGWLSEMHQTFANFPDAGMVGAKLVYPNGVLQEAGGIVWEDGSAWNYGRNGDADSPDCCYARAVDYCSGACLMIRRDLFVSLGMFDELYAPAYYEDTDLAFKIRQAGKQVYYQPNSCVTHFEGVTSGTDTGSGVKQYQIDNQKKFFERWKEQLKSHGVPGQDPDEAKDRFGSDPILVIDERMIMPDNDSGSLRMFGILKVLRRLNRKIVFITNNLEYRAEYSKQLQGIGIELQYFPYIETVESYLQEFGGRFTAVMLSRVNVASTHIDSVRAYCKNAKVIFDTVDLHFLREQREAEIAKDPELMESANARKEQELGIARKSDITVVVSPVELELLQREDATLEVALLSNIHSNYETRGEFEQRENILFIGGFEHPPNADAMEYFLDDVFPLIVKKDPEIVVYILGSNPPEELLARATKNIIVTGLVSDIEPYFSKVKLSIAPLRYGAGVKGKINSSMSFGVPVVASTMAAEGMGLVDGEDVLIGDTPESFADQVLLACRDEALWNRLSDGGKRNIEKYFSMDVAEQQLLDILA
ncbi:MAG: glycosyltransferase [Gammaproteobacteria bacterium]|nr:glycosyltransferase [Gammaproteobacteria bacterium]